ncbi:MAG: PQQ-like domain, partial [Solirubrobacteraceae bacterium]|nr:PQQ-like domain [Solirubrobacteraceae bacterium]
MLDHQAARRVRQGAHAACALVVAALVAAAPARADIPVLTPPAVAPPAPGSASVTLGGDAAHRNAWAGTGLAPPLGVAWSVDASPVAAPVVAGANVIVETATSLAAYALASGAPAWSIPLAGAVELATDGTRVFIAGAQGVAALSAATGATVWAAPGAAATGPVVAGGRLIVGTAAGALAAYQATSGALAWSADTGIAGSRPAVAGNRAYATGHCRAVAIATTTGLPVWTTGTCATDTGTRTLLSDLLVFAEDGGIYQAQDGALVAPTFGPGTIGGGLVFASPLGTGPATLAARDAASFAPRWSWAPPLPGRMALRPAVTEGTVWQVVDTGADGLLLGALDAATGDERWTGFLPQAAGAALTPGVATAVAAVPGVLLVPTAGGKLSALHNVGAGPLGITATVPTNVVAAGSRTTVRGQLVSRTGGLVGPRTVLLEADTHPFDGRYDVAGHTVAGRSGFTFAVRVPRNTRFRLAADGVTYPPTPVYASPRLSVVYHRTKHKLVVRATLRIGA